MNNYKIQTALGLLQTKLPGRKILAGVMVLLLVGSCAAAFLLGNTYISRTQTEIASLKSEQAKLQGAIAKQQAAQVALQKQAADDKKTLEETLTASQDKITALEAKIVDLEKKVAANRLSAASKPVKNTSVYDRIISDNAAAKQKLTDAIKLIETNTPSYFQIIQTHVQEIRPVTDIGCGGGQQIKRTIYISYQDDTCLNSTPTSTFASVIVHEAYHVYNVYVNKVTSSGKAQELPSLYAQRETFDALGVVQSFQNYIESIIAYYESL